MWHLLGKSTVAEILHSQLQQLYLTEFQTTKEKIILIKQRVGVEKIKLKSNLKIYYKQVSK